MIKKFFITLSSILLSFSIFAAETPSNLELPKIEEGKQYYDLKKYPSPDKEIIEFFSFNCPSCYRLDTEYKGSVAIKENLPKGVVFKRYHLDNYGYLAAELSQAWAIANVLGITQEVSEMLYYGIQRDQTIKTANDIKEVFVNLGIDGNEFEKMKNNFSVKAFMTQQSGAAKELKPISIPSFYINSKYLINQGGLDTSSGPMMIKDYIRVINYLSELK